LFDFITETVKNLKAFLNWPGSTLQFEVYDQDGHSKGVYQSNTPPISVDIPNAQAGKWTFVTTAIDAPENNYPFAQVIGTSDANGSCPDCSGEALTLENVTFVSGTVCECVCTTSLTLGSGITIQNGATVTFKAPRVNLKSGFHAENGSVVRIKQQ